ncbi:MAG: hypothetical protein HXS53_03240 [Theionarchaea archaeon]|nr:hypothetical protein [Theionarchaea archaeon]
MIESAGDTLHIISYLTLGILFFVVIWNVAEDLIKGIVPSKPGIFLTFCIATYGFWYPLFSPLRLLYLGFLAMIAFLGAGFSRANIVLQSSLRGKKVAMGIIIGLILFELLYSALSFYYGQSEYNMVMSLISWSLLVYGIVRNELVGMVIFQTGFPRKNYLYAAFILASAVFLPVEFPAVYYVISLGGVTGIFLGMVIMQRSYSGV